MTIEPPEEPLRLRPSKANLYLAFVGSAAFTLVGAVMVVAPGASIIERAAGLLAAGFFGYCFWAIKKSLSGERGLLIDAGGFVWSGGTFGPKRVAWTNIAGMDVLKQNNQAFNRIALKDPQPLIDQFTEDEAKATARAMRAMLGFAKAAGPIAALQGQEGSGALSRMAWRGRARTLEETFAWQREAFGAEILLGWADRDRSAEALERLLRARWEAAVGAADAED